MNLIDQTLGQYQIIELIGAGGMATVYKAYQPGLDRSVAIKVLPTYQQAISPMFEERFIREARAIAQLSHPNILPIYDVGIEDGLSYFVMKYVQGQTLRQLLEQPMDLTTASYYLDQVAGALDHAHQQGILHRDIKPDNILLEGEWLLLADFGLAKIMAASERLTGLGEIMGTSAYVSPEQAEGKAVDQRTDIYSLGIVLYEMVTGRIPFEGGSPLEIVFKHIYEPLPSPRRYNPNLPEAVEQIILKATAKNPAERFERASDMADALRAQLQAVSAQQEQSSKTPARIFICHKHHLDPDQQLANHLAKVLTANGCIVFDEPAPQTIDGWLHQVDREIKASDYLILLLSKPAVNSEMIKAEIRCAYEYRKIQGRPRILLVRMTYEEIPPASIDTLLNPWCTVTWETPADHERIGQEILAAIGNGLSPCDPIKIAPVSESASPGKSTDPVANNVALPARPPAFDPVVEELEIPGGVVKLQDKFYVERDADSHLKREMLRLGTTTTIRAPRQTGKTSLLIRGIYHANQNEAHVIYLDLQNFGSERLASPEIFLRELAEAMVYELQLDPTEIEKAWQGMLGPQKKLTNLIGNYILPQFDKPVILIMDEVDCLLQTSFHKDFFGLVRSWHNRRALMDQWNKLNIVLVISTEPYMLITDVNQSPFNVGRKIYLQDFDQVQIQDLNQRHGSPVKPDELPHLMSLLNGHPYLTRKALYTLITEQITWSDLIKIATSDEGPFGEHLWRHQWLLRNEPDLQEALKEIIVTNRCSDEMLMFRLLRAGLVKGSGEVHTCRCDLYQMYFKDKL